jgi:hypothetical protein
MAASRRRTPRPSPPPGAAPSGGAAPAAAERGAALLLTALAAGLHVACLLRAGPLWRDEANNAALAAAPWSRLWGLLEFDSFPPLFPALLHLWQKLGPAAGDFHPRLLGCLIGLSLLGALRLNRRFLGTSTPLLPLALLALNPVVLCWGDSLRAYGLGAVLLVLAFGLFWKLARTPSPVNFILAAAAGALAVQTLYQSLLFLSAIAAAAALVALRAGRARAAAACLGAFSAAAASLLPYAGIVRRYQEHYVVLRTPASPAAVWSVLLRALSPDASGEAVNPWALALWALLCAAAVAAALRGLSRSAAPDETSDRRDLARYALIVLAVAVPAYLVFLLRLNYPVMPWYFILPMAPLAVALDAALDAFPAGTPARWTRLAAAAALTAVSLPATLAFASARRTNVDEVAKHLETAAVSGDLIILNQWYLGVPFARYYRGPTPWTTLPPLEDHSIHRYDLLKLRMTELDPMAPLLERTARALKSGRTVWLIGGLPHIEKGERAPVLPPAPHGPNGWWNGDYMDAWGLQFHAFMRAHKVSGVEEAVPESGPVNPYEHPKLWKLSGWREAAP